MLPEFVKNRGFSSIISKFYEKNKKDILDIILFGSTIKGKEKPNDLDIMVLFKDKEDLDIAYEIRKKLEKLKVNVQVITKVYDKLFDAGFKAREAFLSEGYSLVKKQFIANGLGFDNITLFKYELKGFSQSRRMQFQYALYGRDHKSGIVKELKLNKFSDSIFFCSIENSERLKIFFESWNIKFEEFPILIPERIL